MNKKFVSRLIRDIVPSPVPRHPYISSRHSRTPSRHSRDTSFLSSPPVPCHSRESGNPEPSSNCANYAVPRIASSKGFTLLEVMVVTTILATLATTTLVTLNPVELLAQMRDSQRITTIGMLRDAVSLLVADRPVTTSLAVTNLVHISLPSIHQNCADIAGLPALPTGQTYRCVTAERLTNIDGTGWIPLDFRGITDGSPFATLPVDPINTSTSFYSFTTAPGERATIAARIESMRQRTIHPPGADGISVFATHFTAAVDRPPLGMGQVAVSRGSTGAPSYSFVGDLDTGIFSPLADNIGFSTAGAERMRIDDIGRVGIGTSAPGERLTVAGVIHSTIGGIRFPDGTLQATAGGATGPGGALPAGTVSQTLRHSGTAWVADSNLFNTGTNVGIGTTAPTTRLEVRGGHVGSNIRLGADDAGLERANINFWASEPGVTFQGTGIGNNVLWQHVAGAWGMRLVNTARHGSFIRFLDQDIHFGGIGADNLPHNRMILNWAGNVGIGTTAPGARLEVAGNIIAAPPTASNHVATRGWVEATVAAARPMLYRDCRIIRSDSNIACPTTYDTIASSSGTGCGWTFAPGFANGDILVGVGQIAFSVTPPHSFVCLIDGVQTWCRAEILSIDLREMGRATCDRDGHISPTFPSTVGLCCRP